MNDNNPILNEANFREALESVCIGFDTFLNGKDALEGRIERKTGFVLLVFPYDDDSGYSHYVSNGTSREYIARLFEEQIKALREREQCPETSPSTSSPT